MAWDSWFKTFRHDVWFHHPITDIWGIETAFARRLARADVYDLAGICATDPTCARGVGRNAGLQLIDPPPGGTEPAPCRTPRVRARGAFISTRLTRKRDYGFGRGARGATRDGLAELHGLAATNTRDLRHGGARGLLGSGQLFGHNGSGQKGTSDANSRRAKGDRRTSRALRPDSCAQRAHTPRVPVCWAALSQQPSPTLFGNPRQT